MAQKIELPSQTHLQRLLPLTLLLLALGAGCDKAKNAEAEADTPAAAPTLEGERARLEAVGLVRGATRSGFSAAIRSAKQSGAKPAVEREFAEEGRRLSFVFSSNNHGERDDCGCKSNPLGGLGRRHMMLDAAAAGGEEAAEWWGEPSAPVDALFVADAGDLFFRSATLDRSPDAQKEIARIDARAVAKAMALRPPDAYVASEIDLVLGLDTLMELRELGGFPFISANLVRDGESVFPSSEITERGDFRVGYIGLTKPKPRLEKYYEKRGVGVVDPIDAYAAAVADLPGDLDMVVLLSNLGIPDTQKVVTQIRGRGVRVDLALVSNSNRLTRNAAWASGVPLVEPLSRGKWLGRVDILLRGDDVKFLDSRTAPDTLRRRYQRAWGAWMNSQRRLNKEEKRLVEARMVLRDNTRAGADAGIGEQTAEADDRPGDGVGKGDQKPPRGGMGKKPRRRARKGPRKDGGTPNITFLERRVETMEKQVTIARKELDSVLAEMSAAAKPRAKDEGDDEIAVRSRPVAIEIPEEPRVRAIIDKADAKKPKKPAKPKHVVPPRPKQHGH